MAERFGKKNLLFWVLQLSILAQVLVRRSTKSRWKIAKIQVIPRPMIMTRVVLVNKMSRMTRMRSRSRLYQI